MSIIKSINVVYMSISGNTKSFVKRLKEYAKHYFIPTEIKDYEIDENNCYTYEKEPYFVIVPTYLEGGNGVDNGDQEIMTEPLRDHISSYNNANQLVGIVGSGNKNFNRQYCLTAKQYSEEFNKPMIGDFELRGLDRDVEKIFRNMEFGLEKWRCEHKN